MRTTLSLCLSGALCLSLIGCPSDEANDDGSGPLRVSAEVFILDGLVVAYGAEVPC